MKNATCSRCGKSKATDQFHARRTDGTSGRRSACKSCEAERKHEYYAKDLEKNRSEGLAKYYREKEKNPDHVRARARRSGLMFRYGMTTEEFDHLLAEQGGTCAICSRKPTHVDHDHACCPPPTKKGQRTCGKCTRGLLCDAHNKMLGNAGDSVTVLRDAIVYLESFAVPA